MISVVLTAIVFLTRGAAGVVAAIIVLIFGTIYARVLMEMIIVFFRIAEHTRDMAASMHPAPPGSGPGHPADQLTPYSSCRCTHHWLPRPSPSCRPRGVVSR